MNNPTPEELVQLLIESAKTQGGDAWWDGEVLHVSFGGATQVLVTVNVGAENLRFLLDKGHGPLF